MHRDKRSFFERLTGAVKIDEPDEEASEEEYEEREEPTAPATFRQQSVDHQGMAQWAQEEEEEGQLSVDVYQDNNDIVIKTMVAGVKPEDLEVSISRDMVTIKGRREQGRTIRDEDFFHQELYWGTFSRTIVLPHEIDPDGAEAMEKYGLLIIKLPKLDKNRSTRLRVKSTQ
ncbi:MAG TPA: Hsp20/alpha crystallin family protein [Candidatus Paceibacterota bacterium]|jgi:HSP20 family protein|nr:Hsp20/alpha crystallin family protein [Candidatus Paceibacterota bacterium]